MVAVPCPVPTWKPESESEGESTKTRGTSRPVDGAPEVFEVKTYRFFYPDTPTLGSSSPGRTTRDPTRTTRSFCDRDRNDSWTRRQRDSVGQTQGLVVPVR